MKALFKIFTLILFALTISCNSTKHPEYIQKIDSLLIGIDSIELKYEEINVDSLKYKFQIVDETTKTIKTIDSLDFNESSEIKKTLINYGRIHKSFKHYLKNLNKNTKDLEFNKNQLLTLKEDISNNLIADSLIEKYFIEEKKASKFINSSMLFFDKDVKNSLAIYEKTQLEINAIIERY